MLKSAFLRVKEKIYSGPAALVFRGMTTLALGSVAARLIAILAIPILTRIYSPEDFGALAVFNSIILILAPLASLRYCLTIPLPKKQGTALNLMMLSLVVIALSNIVLAATLWLAGETILSIFSMEIIAPYWWLISLGILAASIFETLTLWGTRQRAYNELSKASALQGLAGAVTKIALGVLAFKPLGLLIGQVFFAGGGTSYLWIKFKSDYKKGKKSIRLKRILTLARRYRDFPLMRLPSQFLLAFSTQAPVLFFAAKYDANITGQLSMALVVTALPISVIGKSMSNAYFAEAASIGAQNPKKLRSMTKDIVYKLFLGSLAPALVLKFFGEHIFTLMLGDSWQQAGAFASLLSLYIISQFITSPIITVFNVIEKNAFFLALNMFRALALTLILFVVPLYLNTSAETTILIYSIFMTAFYAWIYFSIISHLNKLESKKTNER